VLIFLFLLGLKFYTGFLPNMEVNMKIGLLGVFGIRNTGDNLEALATKFLLEKELGQVEVTSFSIGFSPTALSLLGEQRSGPLELISKPVDLTQKDFWETIYRYDALIIGGGGLLAPIREFEPLLFYGSQIEPARLPKTAWNALGSIWTPLAEKKLSEWYRKVKQATEILDYLSIRSLTTQRLLERVGCPSEKIHLVPSSVIGFTIDSPEPIIAKLQSKFNINRSRPIIGVSIGPELTRPPLKEFFNELARALKQIQNTVQKNSQIIIFPVGEMYGDGLACKMLADLCPDAVLITEPLTPTDIWVLTSMFDVYVTMRYHSVVAAIAQGIPTLALDCYLDNETLGSKLRDLLWQSELEYFYFSPIIEICGEPQFRSFAKIPQNNNISKRIIERVMETLTPESKMQWQNVSQIQKVKVSNHYQMMLRALNLNSGTKCNT
jgi:polysaccharide pyruvyl transferase WcaK-like protein